MAYIKKEPLCTWLSNMGVSDYIIKTIESEEHFPSCMSEWIDVNERLPEDLIPNDYPHKTIKVLVVIKAKNGTTIRTQKRFQDYRYINGGEKEYYWTWRFSAGEVTHWMPLPEPPKP